MWHVSISQQRRSGGRRNIERELERRAIRLLDGVGGDREWWFWSPARVGHLRVPLTTEEAAQLAAPVGRPDRRRRRVRTDAPTDEVDPMTAPNLQSEIAPDPTRGSLRSESHRCTLPPRFEAHAPNRFAFGPH